jgi:hypothetical protein
MVKHPRYLSKKYGERIERTDLSVAHHCFYFTTHDGRIEPIAILPFAMMLQVSFASTNEVKLAVDLSPEPICAHTCILQD